MAGAILRASPPEPITRPHAEAAKLAGIPPQISPFKILIAIESQSLEFTQEDIINLIYVS